MEICTTSEDRGWKEKLAALPRDIKVKSIRTMTDARASLEPRMKALSATADSSMRMSPAKWTGIAAGAGLGIGLIGRFLQHRAQHRRVPAIVIIEATC